jgi:hypothetical protein
MSTEEEFAKISKRVGGSAFPLKDYPVGYGVHYSTGLSYLDYMAAQRLQGRSAGQDPTYMELSPEYAAKDAYDYAEAMLAERRRRGENNG